MPSSRLTLALEAGEVILPQVGRIAVFGPRHGMDLEVLPQNRLSIVTGLKPDYDYFAGLGYDCVVAPEGRFAASIVCASRAKSLARAMIAEAVSVTNGPVIVDGNKTDGIESLLKDVRKRVSTSPPFSKAHGKIFAFEAAGEFVDWRAEPKQIEGGFQTAPGVFSADGIDPGSAMLASHLPEKLGPRVADLGGGWGYLACAVLARSHVEELHLVEADHAALGCARINVVDARARFHWADATRWQAPVLIDTVVMNPPFHTGRSAEPELGRAFIRAAAGMLKPSGELWMVANRHLAYEPMLLDCFGQLEETAGDTKFKILRAARPARVRR